MLVKYSAEISTVDSPTLCAASGIGKDRRSSTRMLVFGRAWRNCNAKVSPARPPPSTTASYRAARLLVHSATDPHAATAILVASKHSTPSSTGSSSSILESFS